VTDADMQEDGQTWASLAQASMVYGVSIDTLRRRIKRHELQTRREQTPQGFRWLVALPAPTDMPESVDMSSDTPGSSTREVVPEHGPHIMYLPNPAMAELVGTLRHELEIRNQEIKRLHEVIAQQAQTIERTIAMLPATISSISRNDDPSDFRMESLKKASSQEDVQQEAPTRPDQSGLWERIRKWLGGSDVS